MKVETLKSIKNCMFFECPFCNSQTVQCFCPFPIMQQRLAITRIWLSQNRGKFCKFAIKRKVRGSWGVTIYIYICKYTYMNTHKLTNMCEYLYIYICMNTYIHIYIACMYIYVRGTWVVRSIQSRGHLVWT